MKKIKEEEEPTTVDSMVEEIKKAVDEHKFKTDYEKACFISGYVYGMTRERWKKNMNKK